MFNRIVLIGNLGRDPEIRTTQSGTKLAKFSIAVTERDETEWFNVVAFNKSAEIVERYLKKGNAVLVEGAFKSNTWTTKEGMKRTDWEVKANNIRLMPKSSPAKSSPPLETLNSNDDLGGWI